ncbi:CLUMA_CG003971, isoform A [Clunio marinus]|uniref:CLUMA_CG003971, isoform A n=1 Tax=Clunio marinus TaxID=568069 RepID=A0A1J1HS99_9DIPT|nr:CLUMA_CG003971, isoform A [Clunio marinus]
MYRLLSIIFSLKLFTSMSWLAEEKRRKFQNMFYPIGLIITINLTNTHDFIADLMNTKNLLSPIFWEAFVLEIG